MSESRCIRFFAIVFVLFALPAWGGPVSGRIRLAAAADLQPALPSILAEFEAQTGIHVDATYQSSSALATAIENGAPFDLFLAADRSFPEKLIRDHYSDSPLPVLYGRGTLVLWTRNDSHFHDLSMDSLHDPALKKLAIANPQHAPYGRAAQAVLQHLKLYDQLQPKLVIAENIAQAAQYVSSGNAELGFISLTSALSLPLKSAGHYIPVSAAYYPALDQTGIVLKHAAARDSAYRLLAFILSPSSQQQLGQHGISPARSDHSR